jgi:serine/threonine protein kinase
MLHHDQILSLTSYFEDNKNLYIVIEYAQDGTLRDLLDGLRESDITLTEEEAFYYFI